MKIHISQTNSKLGVIRSFNLPTCVCRTDAPCVVGCYARKGNWRFASVQQSLNDNLQAFKEDPKGFFEFISANTRLDRYFRWFSSGDIVNHSFFEGMVSVARKNKGTEYLCFTKKYNIVNDYVKAGHRIPKNLHIVFSGWGATWEVLNPYNFPTTWVMFKDEAENAKIPETAIPCMGHCENCLACWQLVKGQAVVFKKH